LAINRLVINNVAYSVNLQEQEDKLFVEILNLETEETTEFTIDHLVDANAKKFTLFIDNHATTIFVQNTQGGKLVTINNVLYTVLNASSQKKSGKSGVSADPEGIITAPLAGIIAKINVKVGDVLDAGETACVIEAMKMQNEIKMPLKGKITKILAKETATVDKGETVINYDPVE
tara:strand:- start:28633 stop:29157 length:525 start_codon:yes stop_codon:yes gene_type:complete